MAKRFVTTKVEVEGREETKVVELPSREPEPWGDDAKLHSRRPARTRAWMRSRRSPASAALHRRRSAPGNAARRAAARACRQRPRHVARSRARARDAAACVARSTMDDVPDMKLDGVQLFDTTVHYANQPIAAICADTLEIAERALDAIRRRDRCRAARDRRADGAGGRRAARQAARQRAPRIAARSHPRRSSRPACATPTSRSRASIARRSRCTPRSSRTARWPSGAADRVTVWESTQGIFNTRADLADAFGLPLPTCA